MKQSLLLRITVAAISGFMLFAALFTLPFAALPVAYIGLAYGVVQAALAAAATVLLTGLLLAPSLALVFLLMFMLPTVVLVRQALLSRALDDSGTQYEFFPLEKLILLTLAVTGGGTVLLFLSMSGDGGMPQRFADAMGKTEEIRGALGQVYDVSTPEAVLQVANLIMISGFASWPLLLLGNLQIAQALLVRAKRNLRPAIDYDRMSLPTWLMAALAAALLVAGLADGWPAALAATLAALIGSAYFLLGLAIIHAISRPWNGRGLVLGALYFTIFIMAWVIIPVALMGLLDTRFDFRGLNRSPDKPSDTFGDEE